MTARTFLIQRYCAENWDCVRGAVPFFATGPTFKRWVIPGSLERHRCYRFNPSLRNDLASLHGVEPELAREAVAELLLREGIVQALWSVDTGFCAPQHERWTLSIHSLADEIPLDPPLEEWVIEYLSGLSGPEHFRAYVSEDGLSLEALQPPSDGF